MTPFALSLIAEAHHEKSQNDEELQRWLIWHQAVFGRMKKMPGLKEFMHPKKKTVKVPIDEAGIKAVLKGYQNGKSRKP